MRIRQTICLFLHRYALLFERKKKKVFQNCRYQRDFLLVLFFKFIFVLCLHTAQSFSVLFNLCGTFVMWNSMDTSGPVFEPSCNALLLTIDIHVKKKKKKSFLQYLHTHENAHSTNQKSYFSLIVQISFSCSTYS